MIGDRYCCKVCKCLWVTSDARKDPSCCRECGSQDIVNLTAAERREAQRSDERRRVMEREAKEKTVKREKMLLARHRQRKLRYSRGRF